MFKSITIDNFRAFRHFEMGGLGRVNLLVGANNSGKTSLLEAVSLLASRGDFRTQWRAMVQRGEWVHDERWRDQGVATVDVRRLFHGHKLQDGQSFELAAMQNGEQVSVAATIRFPLAIEDQPESWSRLARRVYRRYFEDSEEGNPYAGAIEVVATFPPADPQPLAQQDLLRGPSAPRPNAYLLPVTESGGIAGIRNFMAGAEPANIRFVTTASLSSSEIVELADLIQLTDEEKEVLKALQIVDPRITDVRPVSRTRARFVEEERPRNGIIVKLKGSDNPMPIGTLGDGTWRILGLALALAGAKGGVLLVDEIDTGLHYAVMEKMWQLVYQTAQRLDIQVFATTHSRDGYESLAAVAHREVDENSQVTIQRIEAGKERSVTYTEQDIVIAAERGREVR